jgi:leader peptidase (prepilin peptidase)/N-methyltransferase
MTVSTWASAALGAGVLGWIGPFVIAKLPPSRDAGPDTPGYRSIADVPRLSVWLALGAVGLVTIVGFGVPADLLAAWVVVCGVGTWLFYIDWRTQLLPTRILVPLWVVTLLAIVVEAWLAADAAVVVRAVIASLAAYAVFWLFWWTAGLWRPGSFGFGDVRLAAPLGLVLGSGGGWTVVVGLYLGILIGGVAGLVLKARGHHGGSALGPWMLLGAVLGPLVS